MRSMTGFGRGEASNADGTLAFRVEISSVNRKQFELKFNLPRDMVSCEGLIRQAVAARISRGALTLRVEVVSAKNAPAGAALSINRANVRALVDQALDLNAEFDLGGALSLSEMLLVPGIVDQASIDFSLPENTAVLLQACSNALDKLIEMRETEGENLRKTLVSKIEHLSETVNQIEPLVKELPIQQRARAGDFCRQMRCFRRDHTSAQPLQPLPFLPEQQGGFPRQEHGLPDAGNFPRDQHPRKQSGVRGGFAPDRPAQDRGGADPRADTEYRIGVSHDRLQ